MRILLIGQAAFGARTLERLVDRSEEVVGVYAPPDGPGNRSDPLKEAAIDKGIKLFQPDTYKSDNVFKEYRELKPDLTVMAFVTDIIPARFLEAPSTGAICYHPSILPRHRGASAINWAIIMGDTRTGLTIFWADGGIDTGPILLQKEIDIGPEDTTGSLYFDHLFSMGVETIMESIDLIKAGKASRLIQDETKATYEPPCDDRVAGIEWHKTGRQVFNLIRGCDPQPGAYTYLQDEKVRFYGVKLIEEPSGESPGTIIAIDDQGIHVVVSGGRLIVGKVRTAKSGKISSVEFASDQGLKVGDAFGNKP